MKLDAYAPAPIDPRIPFPPGVHMTPGATLCVEGRGAEHLGPEAAGAVTVLLGVLADPAKAESFWGRAMEVALGAQDHDGFIRLLGFGDGIMHYALIFWRTPEAAAAYQQGMVHSAASRAQRATGEQYNHFAATFTLQEKRDRHAHCDRCAATVTLPADCCPSCANDLIDAFKYQALERAPG